MPPSLNSEEGRFLSHFQLWQSDNEISHTFTRAVMICWEGYSEIEKHSSDGLRDLWNKLDPRSYALNRETIRSFTVNPVIWILNSNSRLQIAHLCTPWISQYAIVPFKMACSCCWWPLACASDRSLLISHEAASLLRSGWFLMMCCVVLWSLPMSIG